MTAQQAPSGFPREEFGALIRRTPAYARLAWALARDPRLSRARRLAVLAGAAYVISPIDFVPGIIPVAGQLDDLLVALAAIRIALDGLRPEFRAAQLASVGLSQADLDADVRATGAIVRWMGRSGFRLGRELASAGAQTGARVAGRLRAVGRDVGERIRERRTAGAELHPPPPPEWHRYRR
ncbi:MAG: DUF1232 domain-containing protein [Chloroflexota bacterium]|nr:DUF1232 domain-containing protein [Chloroflexota bacterium]